VRRWISILLIHSNIISAENKQRNRKKNNTLDKLHFETFDKTTEDIGNIQTFSESK